MDTKELLEILSDLAHKDLSEGADISDHPCYLAMEKIVDLEAERAFIGPILDAWDGLPNDLAASLCFDAPSLTTNMEKLNNYINRDE